MTTGHTDSRTRTAATLRLARRLARNGRTDEAVALIEPQLNTPECPLGVATFAARMALAEVGSPLLPHLLTTLENQHRQTTTLLVAAGHARLRSRDLLGAETHARQAVLRSPDRADVLLLRLLCAVAAEEVCEARQLFDSLASRARLSRSARITLASCASAIDRAEAGLRLLAPLVRPPRLLLATLLERTDRWGDALRVLAAVCASPSAQDGPDAAPGVLADAHSSASVLRRAEIARISLLERVGDGRSLEDTAHSWLCNGAADTVAILRLAEAMLSIGRPTLAVRLAVRVLRLHGRHPAALAVLLAVALLRQRPILAHACSESLLPVHARLVGRLGRKARLGNLLRPAPEAPAHAGHPLLIRRLLWRTQRVFSGSLRAHPSFADYRYHRALCLKYLGRERDACADLGEALAINPTYQNARRLQQRLLESRRAA